MINSQGHTIQHYIDVIKWIHTEFTKDVILAASERCFELNLLTSECIDRVKDFISY